MILFNDDGLSLLIIVTKCNKEVALSSCFSVERLVNPPQLQSSTKALTSAFACYLNDLSMNSKRKPRYSVFQYVTAVNDPSSNMLLQL